MIPRLLLRVVHFRLQNTRDVRFVDLIALVERGLFCDSDSRLYEFLLELRFILTTHSSHDGPGNPFLDPVPRKSVPPQAQRLRATG